MTCSLRRSSLDFGRRRQRRSFFLNYCLEFGFLKKDTCDRRDSFKKLAFTVPLLFDVRPSVRPSADPFLPSPTLAFSFLPFFAQSSSAAAPPRSRGIRSAGWRRRLGGGNPGGRAGGRLWRERPRKWRRGMFHCQCFCKETFLLKIILTNEADY